jgi:hypothetical protein
MIYTETLSNLFKEEAEKCDSMSVLHHNSYVKYDRLSIYINLPVIICSAVIGFLSAVDLGFSKQNIMLGVLSICVSLLKALESYFSWTVRATSHHHISLNYKKISRLIQIQLSLEIIDRISPKDLLSIITNDIQNIMESEPLIPTEIIEDFKIKFADEKTSKPSITNGLTSIKVLLSKSEDKEVQVEEEIKKEDINIIVEPTSKKLKAWKPG